MFPLSEETAGDNATIDKFFESIDMKVSDTSFTELADGTKSQGGRLVRQPARTTTKKTSIKLFVWPPQASDKTKPEVVTKDFGSVRFDQNKGVYALALVPGRRRRRSTCRPRSATWQRSRGFRTTTTGRYDDRLPARRRRWPSARRPPRPTDRSRRRPRSRPTTTEG